MGYEGWVQELFTCARGVREDAGVTLCTSASLSEVYSWIPHTSAELGHISITVPQRQTLSSATTGPAHQRARWDNA